MTLETNGKKPFLPKWLKITLALIGIIPTITAAISSVIESREAISRIDQTWKKSQAEVLMLKKSHHKLHIRILTFQAREEGRTAGALRAKLDDLQVRLDRVMLAKKPTKPLIEMLRGELVEVRKLRTRLEGKAAASKAVKAASKGSPIQRPAPPPWKKK